MCPPERRSPLLTPTAASTATAFPALPCSFPNSQVADAIAANAAWTPLPLDETAQHWPMASPREDGGEVFSAGPYLTDDSGDPLLPGIANGFYRLIDRHSDAGDGQNLLERASLNVTLAVYDADSDTLYFCEMDT